MMKVKSVGMVRVSPDGKRVVYTVTEALMTEDKSEFLTQIWMANTDGTGDFQFTRGEKSSSNPRWSPDGRWIAFASNRSGKNNVWLISADGGEAEMLTDVKSEVSSFAWSPDGTALAFTMPDPLSEQEEKDKKAKNDARVVGADYKMNHLWVIPVAKDASDKMEARRLTKGDFTVGGWDWSPDGKTIVFARTPTPEADDWTRSDISVVDVGSAAIKPFASTRRIRTCILTRRRLGRLPAQRRPADLGIHDECRTRPCLRRPGQKARRHLR
jgi:Tol biopolymer transport system component